MAYSLSVFWLISMAAAVAAIVSLVHASIQPAEAYLAADKQTKTTWIVILAASAVLAYFLDLLGAGLAAVAVGVYFVDVRPRLLEVQGKSR